MDFNEYQREANKTDQVKKVEKSDDLREPDRHDVVPLMGLVGEVGALSAEYKKRLCDGEIHRMFPEQIAEELGDILWYVANVAEKFDLKLDEIAEQNLEKVRDRWQQPKNTFNLYDSDLPSSQQIPREFRFRFEDTENGEAKLFIYDGEKYIDVGDKLTDNAYEEDGYRFHDVIHLGFAALMGWSPVLRKLLRNIGIITNRPEELRDVEDGGRAQVIEEAIVAASYVFASEHKFLQGLNALDWKLLRHIKDMTKELEVSSRSTFEWNEALLKSYAVWRELKSNNGGTVVGNLKNRTLTLTPYKKSEVSV